MKKFEELYQELLERKVDPSSHPHSKTLSELAQGIHQIGKKIVEEAAEVWMAAEYESKEQLVLEISQLLYHIQVLAIAKEVSLEEIYEKL